MSEYLTRQIFTETPTCQGVYFCNYAPCGLRQFLVTASRPPDLQGRYMACPRCSREMGFGGWVEQEVVEVEDGRVVERERWENEFLDQPPTPTKEREDDPLAALRRAVVHLDE